MVTFCPEGGKGIVLSLETSFKSSALFLPSLRKQQLLMEILSSKVIPSVRVGEQSEEGQAASGSWSTVPQKPALPGRASSRNLPLLS